MTPAAPIDSKPGTTRTLGRAALGTLAVGGVVLLAALIVHELRPHHVAAHAGGATESTVETTAAAAPASPSPAVPRARAAKPAEPSTRPASVAAHGAPAAPIPLAASLISQVVVSPEAFAPSNTFSPPMAKTDMFHFEQLPPFNSTDLKRSRANPKSWELDAMHGPKMDDLGPAGAVREAAVVKDDIGNSTSWYAIDSGPLAPAYAVASVMGIRVMSRAFVEDHRADFPAPVASLLDK